MTAGTCWPSAVVSDLDGTVIDSVAAMTYAIRAGCAAVGVAVDQDLTWCVGPRIEDSLRTLVGREKMLAARTEFRTVYRATGPTLTQVMPGARAALCRIRGTGAGLAVATYKPRPMAMEILEALGLAPLFDVVVGRLMGNDEREKSLLVRDALEQLGAKPTDAVYIGDHDEDQTAAQQVGIPFIRYGVLTWEAISTELIRD